MSLKFEKQEGNMAVLTIEVPAEDVDKAIEKAYHKIKNQVALPGFRKGKVPQYMIEKQYGVEVFYEDAANFMIQDSYSEEIKNCEEEIVSQPDIEVTQIEKGKPFIYTATVAIKPEVKLGEYKGLSYYKEAGAITDEDVQKELERVQELNSRRVPVENRPAQKDDIVDINYEGSVDGVLFDGGKADNYQLTLGSGTFIPGFEDQIIGHNPGEEFDVNVTFPEDYHAENLKGKEAVFKCKLNEIKVKELPELDDEFAAEVSEFDTLEEYKADVKKNLEEAREAENKRFAENQLVDEAIENAEMIIPDPMVDAESYQVARSYQMNLEQQGFSLDQYLKMVNQTPEQFIEMTKPVALHNIKSRLVLEQIAKEENLEVTDEELAEDIKKMAEAYGMEYEQLNTIVTDEERKNMKLDVLLSKAAEFLYDNGTETEKPAKEEAKEEAAAEAEEKPKKTRKSSKKAAEETPAE